MTLDEKIDHLMAQLGTLDTKIGNLATKDEVTTLKNTQNEAQEKLRQSIEDLERRFKARETFPSLPPQYSNPPRPAKAVEQGSVSKPIWGKRSIYG